MTISDSAKNFSTVKAIIFLPMCFVRLIVVPERADVKSQSVKLLKHKSGLNAASRLFKVLDCCGLRRNINCCNTCTSGKAISSTKLIFTEFQAPTTHIFGEA